MASLFNLLNGNTEELASDPPVPTTGFFIPRFFQGYGGTFSIPKPCKCGFTLRITSKVPKVSRLSHPVLSMSIAEVECRSASVRSLSFKMQISYFQLSSSAQVQQ